MVIGWTQGRMIRDELIDESHKIKRFIWSEMREGHNKISQAIAEKRKE